jgi:hypothetical protein
MKAYQYGGKTPKGKSGNKLQPKKVTPVDMIGNKPVKPAAKPQPLKPGKAEMQKLLRGGSKGAC